MVAHQSSIKSQQSTRWRFTLWIRVSGVGVILWGLFLAALCHFVSAGLPLPEGDVALGLVRDRFLLSFFLTAPVLGALTYCVILFLAGQRQVWQEEVWADGATADGGQPSVLDKSLVLLLSRAYRSPLTTILSSSELIENYGADWSLDRIQRHLTRIQASVRVMTALMNDTLMLVGQSETGDLGFEPVALNLNQFVLTLVESLETTRIRCELPPQEVSVQGDAKLLRSLLTHVLNNALTYSPEDTTVRLLLEHDGQIGRFLIKDQGMGIALAEQERLFEPFFRGERAKLKPGNGLGLAIAQICTQLQGGKIEIETVEDQGTAVAITLPMPLVDA